MATLGRLLFVLLCRVIPWCSKFGPMSLRGSEAADPHHLNYLFCCSCYVYANIQADTGDTIPPYIFSLFQIDHYVYLKDVYLLYPLQRNTLLLSRE